MAAWSSARDAVGGASFCSIGGAWSGHHLPPFDSFVASDSAGVWKLAARARRTFRRYDGSSAAANDGTVGAVGQRAVQSCSAGSFAGRSSCLRNYKTRGVMGWSTTA